jgi:hypothetical protein
MNVLAETPNRRGTELLLAHCAVSRRPSAEERLSAELGGDFSKRLVRALSGVSGRAAAAARPLRTA